MALRLVALLAVVGLAQGPAAWTPLGQVTIDKSGCAACPAIFPVTGRNRTFGVGTDTPYAISLSGWIDVRCGDGTTYNVALRSSVRGGIFQIVPNTCVNLDAKDIKLAISSVGLSPVDAERTVALTVYSRLR